MNGSTGKKITRRQAIGRTVAGVASAAVIAGVGGYLLGSSAAVSVTRTVTAPGGAQTIVETMTRTVTGTTTVTATPRLEPLTVRFTSTQGGRGTASNSLIAENKRDISDRLALSIQYNVVEGTGAAVKELVEGRADVIGPVTVAGLAGAMEQNPDLKIFYFTDIGVYTTLLVGPNSPYNSLSDLRTAISQGRKIKIGYSRPGSLSHTYTVMLAHILGTRVGEGIEGVALGATDAIIAAATRGEIDGFPWTPDVHWRLEEEGRGRIIYYFSEYFGSKWHELSFASTNTIIRNRPELIKRFVDYWREVTRYYLINRDEAIGLMTSQPPRGYGMSRNVAERYYSTYMPNYVGAPNRDALVNVDYFAKLSGVARNPPPPEQWYTSQFI
ncbi:MAG: hypothetical protein NZ957_01580 [Thaumarchaeota archaeon]|nr:hypothetical protein [Candidatus Calditenuaceae archaeon]